MLWSLILYCNHCSSWKMSYPNSTISRIDRLASGATWSVGINSQVLITQLDINLHLQKPFLEPLVMPQIAEMKRKDFKRKRGYKIMAIANSNLISLRKNSDWYSTSVHTSRFLSYWNSLSWIGFSQITERMRRPVWWITEKWLVINFSYLNSMNTTLKFKFPVYPRTWNGPTSFLCIEEKCKLELQRDSVCTRS